MKEIIEIDETNDSEENIELTLEENCAVKGEKNACDKCDFIVNNSLQLKKHLRDVHGTYTGPTSPPEENFN